MARLMFVLLVCAALLLPVLPAPANPVPDPEPTWVAAPPVGVVHQPIGLLFSNTTAETLYFDGTVWEVRDSQGNRVAWWDYTLAAFLPWPPGGTFPGGFLPRTADTYIATAYWSTPDGSGGYVQYSKSISIPVLDGSLSWRVDPDPVLQRTAANYSQVTLTLTNGSTETLWLSSTAPWEITDMGGGHVYGPTAFPVYTPVYPGQSKTWPWALVRQDSSYVPPADYIARIKVHKESGDTAGAWLREPFTVMPRPQGAVVWQVTPVVQSTRSVVQLTLTNATSVSICCNSLIPWTVKDDAGNEVYSPLRLWAILELLPGESRTWVWDERDNEGEYAPAGNYVAEVGYWVCSAGPPATVLESPFRLVDPRKARPCWFLIADRIVEAPGDSVWFTFTNCAPDTVVIPWDHGWWVSNAVGIPVYSGIFLQYHNPMAPGATFRAAWDQKDFTGTQVAEGLYHLCTMFWDKYFASVYVVTYPVFISSTPLGFPERPGIEPPLRAAPNPFRSATRLSFDVARANEPVSVRVLSVAGREVFRESLGALPEGTHEYTWSGTDPRGARLPSGLYMAQVQVGSARFSRKILFLR